MLDLPAQQKICDLIMYVSTLDQQCYAMEGRLKGDLETDFQRKNNVNSSKDATAAWHMTGT